MTQLTTLATHAAASPPAVPRPHLSRRAKAAIIVQFILKEGADVPLTALPEDLQIQLTQLLGEMRYIDRGTMQTVIAEFADELDGVGLSFPGDIAGALSALDGKISAQSAARLRKEAGVRQIGDPWQRLAALPLARLQEFVTLESLQIAAVLVSKLDVSKAAELLSSLPGDVARRVTYAMSMTDAVTPDAVERIGLSLAAQLDAEPPKAFNGEPSERVGAILNFSRASTRDDLLTSLDQDDKGFAEQVRKSIFTFAHIPARMDPIDAPKITRDVDQDTLATAISGATAEADIKSVDFILSNISKRMSDNLKEMSEDLNAVSPKQAEAAMAKIVSAIRDLADNGEITLQTPLNPDD
ncbi:FliG C-terminal domain-containing protein [Marivita sp. XM-24bin2]|jgi:flagellar motor switch protein FliG|uniref:flagellar motor switch protein FliG n=1 Tax=unclassified Marivita TaxID=2632480 RepID=UPI000D7982B2|nr:FliG C-terminal domain-containing protein [Marivita sp. XM-24bin2]MCR9111012.1 flagellar motor switch protein FliG [Paracoccaceae bacterium]PWL33856.1 MAG: flagellar motor switch protein FliG [Marivita sp. XM-24bin2]